MRELNRLYRANPALYQVDFHYTGFEWVDFHDWENSDHRVPPARPRIRRFLLFCCNFTPVPRQGYEFGVPEEGFYEEILNTDSELFGGIQYRQRRHACRRGQFPNTIGKHSASR